MENLKKLFLFTFKWPKNKWALPSGALERPFWPICSLAPDGSAHLFFGHLKVQRNNFCKFSMKRDFGGRLGSHFQIYFLTILYDSGPSIGQDEFFANLGNKSCPN